MTRVSSKHVGLVGMEAPLCAVAVQETDGAPNRAGTPLGPGGCRCSAKPAEASRKERTGRSSHLRESSAKKAASVLLRGGGDKQTVCTETQRFDGLLQSEQADKQGVRERPI